MMNEVRADTQGSPMQRFPILKVTEFQNIFTTMKANCAYICAVCACVSATTLFAAIVVFGVYMGRNRVPVVDGSTPFCCPEEAKTIARNVNRSVKPCNDFFAYVCTNHTSRSSKLATGGWRKIIVTGILPEGARIASAGVFLTAYYKSCVETTSRHEIFFLDLALGLVRTMRQVLWKPNARNALAYFLTMSLRYNLYSFIGATFDDTLPMLQLHYVHCIRNPYSQLALQASALALRNTLNMTVAEGRAIQVMDNICAHFPSADPFDYDVYPLDGLLFENFWDMDDIKAGLEMLGVSVQNTTIVQSIGVKAIGAIYKIFSAPQDNIPHGVKAVLQVWKSIESAQRHFHIQPDMTSPRVFKICEQSLIDMAQLVRIFAVQLLVNASANEKAMTVFGALKDIIYEDCRSSSLFDLDDKPRLETLFRGMSILNPEVITSWVEVPIPDRLFSVNLMRGRAYNFDFLRKRTVDFGSLDTIPYKSISYQRRTQLFLFPPDIYVHSAPGSSFRSELLTMTILGRLMAESLWYVALRNYAWGSKTVANVQRLLDCLVMNHQNEDEGANALHQISRDERSMDERYAVAADVLGLASIFRALSQPDWHTVKHAWSLLSLSHGQVFYILTTFDRCSEMLSPQAVHKTNAPLKELDDFARTFHCAPGAPMAPARRCMFLRR